MLFLGRGLGYPIALEGALKLKEIAYIHAEGYAAGEMKHGPIALIDEDMPVVVVVAARQPLREDALQRRRRCARARARSSPSRPRATARSSSVAQHVIVDPRGRRVLTPLLTVLPLQLLAYYIADLKGTDVDQPRNLAKTVTVE